MAATELSYGKLKKWLLGKGCAVSEVENCPDKAHLLILMQKKGIEVTLASAELPITAVLLEVVPFYLFFCSEFPLSCLSLVQDDAPADSGPDTPEPSANVPIEPNIDLSRGAPELPKLVKRRPSLRLTCLPFCPHCVCCLSIAAPSPVFCHRRIKLQAVGVPTEWCRHK